MTPKQSSTMNKQQTPKQRQYLSTVLKLYWQKGMSTEKISRYLGIGHTTVCRWISIFAGENPQTSPDMPKENKKQHSRNAGNGTMIDLAEEKLNIPVRKKYSAKQ